MKSFSRSFKIRKTRYFQVEMPVFKKPKLEMYQISENIIFSSDKYVGKISKITIYFCGFSFEIFCYYAIEAFVLRIAELIHLEKYSFLQDFFQGQKLIFSRNFISKISKKKLQTTKFHFILQQEIFSFSNNHHLHFISK